MITYEKEEAIDRVKALEEEKNQLLDYVEENVK